MIGNEKKGLSDHTEKKRTGVGKYDPRRWSKDSPIVQKKNGLVWRGMIGNEIQGLSKNPLRVGLDDQHP